jgi:transcriptional regulator with XRE-family HTH domain
MKLDAVQCRMARAALGLGVRDLAALADVSPNTVARLERGDLLHVRTQEFIRGRLEAAGVSFIDPGVPSLHGEQGVRLGPARLSRYGELHKARMSLPHFHVERPAAVAALTDILARYLEIIESEGREPDIWERGDLQGALGALAANDPFGAHSWLERAITPPDNQSPDNPISSEVAAETAHVDLNYLRNGLAALRASSAAP